MGSGHCHPPPLLLLMLALLLTAGCASAQSPSSDNNNNNNNNPYLMKNQFNPSMAIVIVVLISAFFFLGFFSVYIRQCAGDRREVSARASAATAGARSRRQRGLDADLLATFPTLVYSDVKAHKIGKGSLECAVCLSEFEDDETLRLLPQCSHVFHTDCIDAWLSAHVTCPVCRTNLADPVPPPPVSDPQQIQEPPPPEAAAAETQVAIEIDAVHQLDDAERNAEMENLENFVNMKRARSRARPARFPRSHSTGHSLVVPGENLDRFTLRLPENIRREIVSRAERLQRTKSCVVAFPSEGSSRRGFRGGEGSNRGTRSIRLGGRSGRWGSSLLRTLSMKVPTWGRRGGGGGADEGSMSMKGEGSVTKGGGFFKGGDSMKGEGSMRKFNSVIAPFDCYGGGAAKNDGFDSQSSTAALNRV